MSKEVRVRFAPSPTGNVHIGNIRAAIFNYLFARHNGGKFLLRVEDTDKERSTQEAVDNLLKCMDWLALEHDEEVFYQSSQEQAHISIANRLVEEGKAYRATKGDGGEVVLFRIPQVTENCSNIVKLGDASQDLHPEATTKIDKTGLTFFLVSRKGKAVPQENMCLAGFHKMKLFNEAGEEVFDLESNLDALLSGDAEFAIEGAVKMTFVRHAVSFTDMIKGELKKPLDSIKDLVIVKSNGSPLFHLANICDDITQKMSHIIRGDDHVENTYRHVLLYHALGEEAPVYAHLPMIVNKSGKPYSKRDGDAYVGDFKSNGYLADTLFNYLILLGWSPGNDQEKVTREEAIKLFELERCKSTAAQMDMDKLYNLNGQYLAELTDEAFFAMVQEEIKAYDWYNGDTTYLKEVSALMHSRTKLITQLETWDYFFTEGITQTDEKKVQKVLNKEIVIAALTTFVETAKDIDFTDENIEATARAAAEANELNPGKINQPLRLSATAAGGGAELFPTLALVGKEKVLARIQKTIADLSEK